MYPYIFPPNRYVFGLGESSSPPSGEGGVIQYVFRLSESSSPPSGEGGVMQCPFTGGKVIYQIRALAMLLCDSLEYDDEIVCSPPLQARHTNSASNSDKRNLFHCFAQPNPAVDFIDVNIANPGTFDAIKIYDSLGRQIRVFKSRSHVNGSRISLINQNSGIYSFKLFLNNLEVGKGKFVVNR